MPKFLKEKGIVYLAIATALAGSLVLLASLDYANVIYTKPSALAVMKADSVFDPIYRKGIIVFLALALVAGHPWYERWVDSWKIWQKPDQLEFAEQSEAA